MPNHKLGAGPVPVKPRLKAAPCRGGRGQGRLEERVQAGCSHAWAQKDPLLLETGGHGQFTLGPLEVAGASWGSGLGAQTSVGWIHGSRVLLADRTPVPGSWGQGQMWAHPWGLAQLV